MAIDEGINEYSEWSCTCENLNMHTENDPSGCGCVPGQWSIKRYKRIRICLTGEAESPSSPIRRQELDVKYLEKVERQPDRIPDVRHPEKVERRSDRILPQVEWAMSRVARGTVCVCKGERATWHFLGRIPQVGEGLERETGLVVWLNGCTWVW